MSLSSLIEAIEQVPDTTVYGRVGSVLGMTLEVGGIERLLSIGDRVRVVARNGTAVPCEVVGFRGDRALVLPFGSTEGVGLGCRAFVGERQPALWPSDGWLGRVINALGEPIDGKGPLPVGIAPAALRSKPPPAQTRDRVGAKIDLGVRALNTFVSCCRGQRMGIFAGSGVGKSVMMAMMARYTEADVNVIGLVGERGREVQEFIQDDLGEEGLARSVVVVATSDESPLMRRQAAYATLAVAEHFRDAGAHVLCMIDSITRFAMAQREIGLSVGEPPTSKGYPPTTFAELPRLLERAGPGPGNGGAITGLFTVLVDGDDHNEPIADAVRSILDGHIVLERAIAERGRYPAINVLKSVSRTMPNCNSDWENALVRRSKQLLSTYDDMAEMIRLGAYRKGTDAEVDRSIDIFPEMEAFLGQQKGESTDLATGYRRLAEILNEPELMPAGSGSWSGAG